MNKMMNAWSEVKPSSMNEQLLIPTWARIVKIIPECDGISTYHLSFLDSDSSNSYKFKPGQFNMLYIPGFGEAAISLSSNMEHDPGIIVHTVRHVGSVTKAMQKLNVGDVIGLRGPFGTSWPLAKLQGNDIVIACGGIGLPPLRGALYSIIQNRSDFGKVTLLYGARTPKDLMFPDEYEDWLKAGIDVQVTVDRGDDSWAGRVGVVPMWFYNLRVDPRKTYILSCGPEIMMRFVIYEALARRIPTDQIFLSLERNMKCGQGACGHCQQGQYFICKDGPVFSFNMLESIFNIEEY